MASTIKVDNYDLSTWQRLQPEDGYDPTDSAYSEPQFAGTPAFSEGAAWTTDAVGNRKLSIPLILKGSSTDDLYRVVREINTHLFKGARVEFAMDGAAASTFFDLERGRVDANFEYYIARAGRLRCVLELWTRPFGNTGTARSIASVTGTGPLQIPATGILGDRYAEVNVIASAANAGLAQPSPGFFFAWGVHRSASFIAVHPAASLMAGGGGTLVGASGAIASQYYARTVTPTAAVSPINDFAPPLQAGGRYRVLAIARSHVSIPSAAGGLLGLYYQDSVGNVTGSVGLPLATSTATGFMVSDLGEFSFPSGASGLTTPTAQLTLNAIGASGGTALASPGLDVQAVIHLPLSESAGVISIASALVNTHPALRVIGIGQPDVVGIDSASQVDRALIGGPAVLRGDWPRMPNVGSGAAAAPSGPAQMVVLHGVLNNFLGNAPLSVAIDVRERFTFLRG